MNWTAAAVIGVILLIFCGLSFWGGAEWQGLRKDDQYRDSLSAMDAMVHAKSQEINFQASVIHSRDAEIERTSQAMSSKEMELVKQRGAVGKLRRLADSIEKEMSQWELDSGTTLALPVAKLDIFDTTSATVNDTTIKVAVNYGARFSFIDLTWRDAFCRILPVTVPIRTFTDRVVEPYSPPLFGGVWFSGGVFKEYRAKFASSELIVANVLMRFEWNLGKTVLETDPFVINFNAVRPPEYGFRLGFRQRIL